MNTASPLRNPLHVVGDLDRGWKRAQSCWVDVANIPGPSMGWARWGESFLSESKYFTEHEVKCTGDEMKQKMLKNTPRLQKTPSASSRDLVHEALGTG